MQVKITVEVCDGGTPIKTEVAVFEREALSNETCGLSMAEAKALLAGVQQAMVGAQAQAHLEQHHSCPRCGVAYGCKDTTSIVVRTLFDKVRLQSPRYRRCRCQKDAATRQSFSPLATVLAERTTPELRYLQCKWSALLSYGMSSQLLADVLPLDKPISTAVLSRQVQRIAQRSEAELGAEEELFGAGTEQDWASLAQPAPPLTVGIDGGWVHGREGKNRKAGSFELIVGKSMSLEGAVRRFGFVNGYDTKPRRRLLEVLRRQGTQPNQQVTFLSDGGDTVRNLQKYLHPLAEHLLDWFHIVLRLRVLRQLAQGLATKGQGAAEQHGREVVPKDEERVEQLQRVKWYLWHGNVFSALGVVRELESSLRNVALRAPQSQKLLRKLQELRGYIKANEAYIVNYGDRYRHGETISTAFVESTVNELISKRMVKAQQMRWTKAGAHRLLQLRVQVLDGELRRNFERWYPGVQIGDEQTRTAA